MKEEDEEEEEEEEEEEDEDSRRIPTRITRTIPSTNDLENEWQKKKGAF